MITREAGIEPVETRQSKRAAERSTPYEKETLQERLQKQASYGRPKVLQPKSVRFGDEDVHERSVPKATPKEILRHRDPRNEPANSSVGVVKPPRSATKPPGTLETLMKLGYSYEGSLSKLLSQTTIPPGFTLGDMVSLVDPALHPAKRSVKKPGRIDRKMQETLIDESEIGVLGFERMPNPDRLCQIVDVCPVATETFSGYSDFHSPTPKVVVTLTGTTKLSDVRATLDTGAEVSVMTLDAVTRFEIPVTYSSGMALRTIIGSKSRFVGFADNVPVTIGNSVVRTRFYIMDCPGIKIILGFPFFRKARVTLRYPRDEEDSLVFALFYDPRTSVITIVKTNNET